MGAYQHQTQHKCIVRMRSTIVLASTKFMVWLRLTAFDFLDHADSGRYSVYYRCQFHINYAVNWIVKAPPGHKSVDYKNDM